MIEIFINNKLISESTSYNYESIVQTITERTFLEPNEFYLEHNGKRISPTDDLDDLKSVKCILRTLGGKGGFGSMLRAIGAQIEKTTNREACRDLSGRRLRDINEEKRLKSWLDKQGEREREAEERKKRKLEKLLAVPKLDFKDEQYEESRSKLTEKVSDAVEEGLKKVLDLKKSDDSEGPSTSSKRKGAPLRAVQMKKKKSSLWIGDDISDSDDSSSSESSNEGIKTNEANSKKEQLKNPSKATPVSSDTSESSNEGSSEAQKEISKETTDSSDTAITKQKQNIAEN